MGRPYAKIAHSILTDEDTEDLSDGAFALFVKLIIWSSRQETDGVIPSKRVRKLGTPRAKRELLLTKLCSEVDQHLVLRSYTKHNTSKKVIEEKRAKNAARMADWRARCNNVTEGATSGAPSTEFRDQSSEIRDQRLDPPDPPGGDKPKPKKKSRARSKMTQDWEPSESPKALAREYGFTRSQWSETLDDFRDYWVGNGKIKADWDATLRSWIRRKAGDYGLKKAENTEAMKEHQAKMKAAEEPGDISGTIEFTYGVAQ